MADTERPNCLLPPSPNWYCSSSADCSVNGIYAFAAKNHIFLMDINCDPPVFKQQFSEHSDRTSAVVCCPHVLSRLCASASDDKTVKIWDTKSKIIVASHHTHHAKITCLCWSSVASDLVISADEKGTVIAWRYNKNVIYSACPVQEYVFCISTSYHSEHMAAAGYKNGLIVVLQLDEHGITVTHHLRGHDSDIHSLVWCPVSMDRLDLGPLQEKALNSKGNLIISGSRDQTIRLWDALNGKLLSIFNLPKRSSQKWRDRHDFQSKDRVWLSLCWPQSLPNKIISSSHSGELLLWNLSVSSGPEQIQYFAQGHSRIVFNISCNKEGTKAVSFSMDRQIIIWDLQSGRSLHSLSTLGGFAYALDISPLDPGTVAVGVGDNMIRVWHTTSPTSTYDTVTLWQGIKSKVQVVSWHPQKEGLLGFGTDNGQVGIYNTVSKKPKVFASYHKNTVYSLSWGPPCPENKDKDADAMHLYSCSGDGSVLEHRPNQPLQDAINVNGLIQSTNGSKHKLMSCTDVSWNCNGSMLAIGNHDGTIEVFVPPSLKRVCTVSVHKKSITFLAWHPGYGDDSNDGEGRLTYRLASGSNETTIHIHDLSSVLRSCDSASENLSTITSSHRKLVGHCGRITSLCWSPHHCDMLVSASYDGTAQVWDVETNQTLANFRGHVGRLLSVQWSYLDAHVVYSGGEDGSVRPWSISGQKYTQPPATVGSKTSKPKKKSKSKTKETPEAKTSQNDEETTLDIVVQQTGTRSEGIPDDISRNTEVSTDAENKVESWRQPDSKLSWRSPETTMIAGSPSPINAHAQNSDEPQENDTVAIVTGDDEDTHSISSLSTQEPGPTIIVSKSKGEATKKKRKFKSMFPLSAVADNNTRVNVQQDCIELAQYLAASHPGNASAIHAESSIPGESSSVNLGFFADRSSAYKMFEAEGRHHSSANNLDYQLQLEVWKGNLGGALQMAIEAKQLSDWLVATSALAGHDVWLHTAESYADQLKSEGAHQRAVLYYLVCHKVYLAIDVFKKQSMFREAIALAKVRLSPSDPVLHDLYCSWARKLEIEHYESAAKCYLAAGLPADAVRVLSVRGDQASLTTALKVSVVSGMHQLSSSLAVRVMHICMGTGNWYAADEALALCTGVEGHVSALYAHEIFVSELLQEGLMSNDEFKEQCHSKIFTSLKKGEKQSIIESCLETASLQESPWLMDAPPSDWVISHILKAWDRAGILNGSLLQSTLQQLSSYSHSNLNENLSIKQILTRISYDISLGLLCGVRQDLYSCSLPWLQTLESCIKSGYFVLAQILCVRLLPRGAQSLDDISVLRRALNDSTEPRVTKEHEVSNDKLFSYFNGFYNLLMLYNIWWRDPMILPRFRANNECKDITTITENISRENSAVQHVALNVAERIAQEIATIDNCTLVESAQGQEVPADVTSTAEDETSNEQKEPLSANSYSTEVIAVNPSNTPLDMYTVLRSIQESLLSENVGICAALKKQLLEVKKEVILLRSRRILDSVAAASSAKQKRTSKKKSKVNQASKGVAEGLESNKITSPLVESSESSDVCEVSENVGDHAEAACCDTTQVNVSTETSLLPSIEPLDVRYKLGVWTLELMQEEEQRLQEELSKQPLKDFPFPVPTESAMVIGYVCSKANTYPCHEPAVLYKLGLEGVTSALEHAQWDLERKILKQIEKRLLEVNTS